jgi:hypothetical protein
MLTLLTAAWISSLALAEDGPTFVVVDREVWLYTQPEADARRLRTLHVPEAPTYLDAPVLVLERLGERDGFVHVRTVPMTPRVGGDGMLEPPSEAHPDWPHCYAPPPALAQLQLDLWVKAEDLREVVHQPIRVEKEDGSFVALAKGVAVYGGRDGRYRVAGTHLDLTVRLPEGAVAKGYRGVEPGRLPPVDLTAGPDRDRYRVEPMWRARVFAAEQDVRLTSGELDPEIKAVTTRLSDRCIDVGLSAPVAGVPERVPPPAEDALRLPVRVPSDTVVTWSDGEILGHVREGEPALWARRDCEADELLGTCCSPPSGMELQGGQDQALSICFAADMPEINATRSLRQVFGDLQVSLIDRAENPEKYRSVVGNIVWATPVVMGSITPGDINAALVAMQPGMRSCYS